MPDTPPEVPTAAASRRRGRPSTPVLSPEKITRAAVTLVETKGHRALTMAALADHLHVAPSALYNHVPTKTALLRLVQDYLNASIDASAFEILAWPDALRAWARSYRDVYARHPPLVPLMAVTPVDGAPHTVAMYEAVAAGLRRGGWPAEAVVDVIVAVESFVLGSALDASAPDDIFDVGPGLAGTAPEFAAAVAARTADDPARAAFDLGLDVLVEGLRVRSSPGGEVRPRPRPAPPRPGRVDDRKNFATPRRHPCSIPDARSRWSGRGDIRWPTPRSKAQNCARQGPVGASSLLPSVPCH